VDPVRVKVYGLFSLTRSRYVRQASAGFAALVLVLFVWWLGWPVLAKRFTGVKNLPGWMLVTVAILKHVPWLLLGVSVWKAVEMWFVLRAFARKEKSAAAPGEATSLPSTSSAL